MDILSSDLSAMVFKRVLTQNLREFPLDGGTLSVLMEFDGRQSVGTIAKKLGMTLGTIRPIISVLLQSQLIEAGEDSLSLLDEEFMTTLKGRLALAVGPIAEVLIEDAAEDMGFDMNRIPAHRVAELVSLLAGQIRREEKVVEFKQFMLGVIRGKGY